MDTTKEYIEMCKAAEEIQAIKKHAFSYGDSFINNYSDNEESELYLITDEQISNQDENCFGTEKGNNTWLPRQDQLQEIIVNKGTWINAYHMMQIHLSDEEWINNGSWEQMWLRVAMRVKYNKQWNPETKQWIAN